MARVDVTQRFYEALRLQFLIGAVKIERVVSWAKKVLEVEREAGVGDPWAQHELRAKRLSTDLDGRPRTAPPTPYDRLVAEYVALEAGLWVAGQQGKEVPAERVERRGALARELFSTTISALERGGPIGPGDPDPVEAPYLASIRWLEADRDEDERRYVQALERHLERALRLEGAARVRSGKGTLARPSALPVAESFRWEAEVYVASSKSGGASGRRKAFLDHWVEAASVAHETTLGEFRERKADVEDVHLASLRLFDAERARGSDLRSHEALLARTQRLERELRQRDDCPLGLAPGALECFKLDAEARLAKARVSS